MAVKAPESVLAQLRRYVEKNDGTPMGRIGKDYPYLPVYNVLAPKEKRFVDGV